MGGFITGFLGAGGQEALGEKHHRQEQNDAYRAANLNSLLHIREIAASNGASQEIIDQLNKSIGELQPGHHASASTPGTPAQQTQSATPNLTLPGMPSVPMVGESPTVDLTGNTPQSTVPTSSSVPGMPGVQLPGIFENGKPSGDATITHTFTPPQPGVFMRNGVAPRATPDQTPIVPPAAPSGPGPTIPGQSTTVSTPAQPGMTLSRAMVAGLNPVDIARQQAYVKQIEAQSAYQQQISQFQQTMDSLEPMLKKAGLPDAQIQQIKRNAAIQQFSPRAFMSMARVPHLASAGALDIPGAIAEQERTGEPFYDNAGQPIDLAFVKQNFPNAQLNPVYGPGGQQYWQVGSQANKTYTYDNQAVIGPSRGNATPENTQVLGQKQVPVTTNRQVPSAGGGTLNLQSARTPQTPPQKTAPTPANPTGTPVLTRRDGTTVNDYQGNAVAADSTAPKQTDAGKPAPTGTSTAKSPKAGAVGKFIKDGNDAKDLRDAQTQGIEPDMTKLYGNQGVAARKALPALVATRGIFGDPERPELPTISDFSDLANDPHAQKVLGAAFNLMAASGPIGFQPPPGVYDGTLRTMADDLGFRNWQSQVQQRVQQRALADATPRELSYFNSALNAMADVIGMRGATGANAAQWSVEAIQKEVPLIGFMDTRNQQSYIQKLLALNSQAGNIINTMPDKGRAKAWLLKRERDLVEQQKNSPASRGSGQTSQNGGNQAQVPKPDEIRTYQGHNYKFDGKQWVLQ